MAKRAKSLIRFYPYQQKYIADKSKFKITMQSRQTGKTLGSCAEIVQDCLFAESQGKASKWTILSSGERQAKEAMNSSIKPLVKAFYSIYKDLQEPVYSESEFKAEDASYKALEVGFSNSSVITAVPANPATARGFSRNVFLDEFAFHKDSREIWKAVFPIVSRGDLKLRIASTPNGKANKFYELWNDQSGVWSKHRIDIYDAIKQGLPRDAELLKKALNDEDAWRQEYELEFLDEASSFFTFDLINAVESKDANIPKLYEGGNCYIGVDVARRKDLWVAVVLERVGDVLWQREMIELKNQSFYTHEQTLAMLLDKYKVIRVAIDQTGMGEKVVEDAKRRFGNNRVQGVLFTNASKQDLAITAKQYFEDKKLRLPIHKDLRNDLHSIKKETLPSGLVRFVANREAGSHADRAWALILAISAGATKYQNYNYIQVTANSFKKGLI